MMILAKNKFQHLFVLGIILFLTNNNFIYGQNNSNSTISKSTKSSPTVTATASNSTICLGEQSTLSATGNGGTPPYTFNWDNGLGIGTPQTVSPINTTIYNVTITDFTGLTATNQITISVFDLPTSNLSSTPNSICLGNSTILDANPSSGNAPYSFSWDNGLGSGQSYTISPINTTTYNLTITDSHGCTVTDQITTIVNENPTPTPTATPQDACSGSTVTLDITSIGGSSPYSYSWNGGLGNGASHLINPTIDFTYSVTVTDANGCTNAESVPVNVYELPNVTTSTFPTTICAFENGTISAIGDNGQSPYTYTWDNGLGTGASHIISPASTTTYNVTVTDANGCTARNNVTMDIWELPVPTASASPNSICENTPTTLNVTSTNGLSPYSYNWSQGLGVGTTHTITPLSDQTYFVTATDANGCTSTDQITVTVNTNPTATATASPNISCSFEPVNLSALGSGTSAPYSYVWNNSVGPGQNNIVNTESTTTYTVTVTDGNGCTASAQTTVTTQDLPIAIPIINPNPICLGASTNITVSSTNGLPPYSYVWDNGLSTSDNQNITPPSSTLYTVTVTDSNGCSSESSTQLNLFDLPTINLSATPNPICDGGNSIISTILTGGNSPFMFAWDNGLGNAQNPTITPLSTTTYTLTVTDGNGCTSEDNITVNVNTAPTTTASATPENICPGQTSIISASAIDGTAPYSFNWDNGLGSGANHTVSPASTTTYSVTTTDAAGCTSENQITISVYDSPTITLSAFPNPICALEISALSASATNGTPAYTYSWDHGLGTGSSQVIAPSISETYNATVTDANGCQDIGSIFVQVVELPSVTAQGIPNPICEGEVTTLNAIGNQGTSPYSFHWNQGIGVGSTHDISPNINTTFTVTISDANGCTSENDVDIVVWPTPTVTGSATPNSICAGDNTNLSATAGGSILPYTFFWDNGLGLGANQIATPVSTTTYNVLVSDGHGCTSSDPVTVLVTEMPPATPTATPNPICSGEPTTLTVTGNSGTAPYSYFWDNGIGAGQTHIVSPLTSTTYSVTITDATGCTTEGSILVNTNDLPIPSITASANPICESGNSTISSNVTSGTAPYYYSWDNGLPTIQNPVVAPIVATTYNLTVTDANGCSNTDQITVDVAPAPTVTIIAIPNPVCEGETVNLSANGLGTIAPYTYSWDNSMGIGQNQTDNPLINTTYTVTVTDGNGCTNSDAIVVNTLELPQVTASIIPDPICSGETVNLSAIGNNGLAPYIFTWDNSLGDGQNQTDNPLTNTTYTVTITDNNGCTNENTVNANINTNPISNLTANPSPICEGSISILTPDVTSGTSPYTYLWDNGLTAIENPVVSPITSTTYNLTITDNNGCSTIDQITLNVNTAPTLTTNAIPNPICPNTASTISATAGGTTPPYSYFWDNGLGNGQNHVVTPAITTTYNVTATDGNGCTNTSSITLNTFIEPEVTATVNPNPICSGEPTNLSATGNSGLSPYTYTWNNGLGSGQNQIVSPIISTNYTVTISDANSCTSESSIFVNVKDLPSTTLTSVPNPICQGENTTLDLIVNNGTSPYSYLWSGGLGTMQNPSISPTTTTVYTVTVADFAGCTVEDNVVVTVNDRPDITTSASPATICGGENSILSAIGSNGTPPYSFSWDNGIGNSANNTVSPTNTTTYTVTITDANGCTNTDQVTVTIANSPNLTLTANPNPICSLETVFLTGSATGGSSPYTYTWDNGLGSGSSQIDTPITTTTYTVSVSDNNGCQDIETITVSVAELPSVTIEAIPNPICNGDPVTVNATSTNGQAPYSYSWDNGLGVGANHTITPSSDHTYTVTVSDDNGCTASDNIDVVVNPTPNLTANATPNPICEGENVNISANASGTTTPYTYFWDNGIGLGNTHTVNPVSDITYNVVVSDGNGCTETQSVDVSVFESPDPNLTATPNPLCLGDNTTLNVSSSNGLSPYIYSWNNGLGSGSTHIVSPITDESYTVTVTDANLCTSTADIDVIVNPTPIITINASTNPVCAGESTVLTANTPSITEPHTNVWDNGLGNGDSHTVNPLVTTTYQVTTTDGNGCTAIGSVTLNVLPTPTVSASVSSNSICDGANTTLDATGSAGTPLYSYTWDNGLGTGQSHTITPISTTDYTVTITDANLCTASDIVTVTVNPNPSLNLTTSQNIICEGESSTLIANTTGGMIPYNYTWNPALGSGDSQLVSPIVSTSYQVTVSDANSCSATDQTIITVNPAPIVTLSATPNPICFNESSNITTNVIGGTPAYTYSWDHSLPPLSEQTVTLSATDTYQVSVQDINGCKGTGNITIDVNPQIIITTSILSEISCNGNSDASFSILVSGGLANYDINWTNGINNGNFLASAGGPHIVNGVTAGNYTINVTDASACTESYNFTINEPDVLDLTINSTNDISCNGEIDGSANLIISGGTPTYTIDWDNGINTDNISMLSAGSYDLSGLEAGTYNITLTDDNGCTSITNFTLSEPSALTFSETSTTNVPCLNGSNGAFTVNIGGGTPMYSLSWDNGITTGTQNGLPAGSSQINGLTGGNYTVILTDASSCTSTVNINIQEPTEELELSILSITDASCVGVMDGSGEVSAIGGVPIYTYTWDNPNGSGTQINNVTAGDYEVTVTDSWGCEDNITVTIGQPASGLSANPDITPVSCISNSDGNIDLNTSGGTTPYSYTWDPSISTTETATNLASGNYDVTINDAGTCELILTINVPVDPNTLTAEVTDSTDVNCNGGNDGEIQITASNGLIPYSYSWSEYPSESTNTLTNITAGNYTMTVTDAHNCEIILNQNISEPAALSINLDSIHHGLCFGDNSGEIFTTPLGGTPTYNYTWENASGNNLAINSDDISGLTAGTYYLSLTDVNGCGPATANFTITEPADALSININIDNLPSCPGDSDGEITASTSGGTAPYTYLWDNPIAGNTSPNQSGLAANTYTVTVTDSNNCTAEQNIVLNDPPSISINIVINDVLCFGNNDGLAVAQVTGGNPGYTYNWEDALNTNISNDDTVSNLVAGNYFITITDANNCNAIDNITVNEPNLLTGIITHTNVSTWGNIDGTATATPSEGTSPYSYEWENVLAPGVIISTNQTATNLSTGTYSVTITDANGCIWTDTVIITQPNDPLGGIITIHEDVLCAPDSTGNLSASAYGATSPYSYYWENSSGTWSANTASITNLPADIYSLTITDNLSYEWDTTITITQPPILEITSGTHTDLLCYGDSTATANITVNGGIPMYNYLWDDPLSSTLDNITNAPSGLYTVLVTDQNGCTVDTSFNIIQPEELNTNISVTATPTCFGDSDGSLSIIVTGGNPAYSFLWEDATNVNISSTDTVVNIAAGNYFVSVTDANGCTVNDNISLTEPPILGGTISHTNVSTWGNNDGSATAFPNGGTSGYTYNWEDVSNPGISISSLATANSLFAGNYSVTITDDNGCLWTNSVTITEPNDPLGGNITNHEDVLCAPDSTGTLTAQGYGATPPYSYSWENLALTWSSSSNTINNLPADTYNLTITDANLYTWDTIITISQPTILEIVNSSHVDILCNGDSTGTANIVVNGGISTYTYNWDDPTNSTLDNIANAPAGTYTVIVTDQNGCNTDTSFTITEPTEIDITMLVTAEPLCNGDSNGSIGSIISEGTPNYNYTWENSIGSIVSLSDTIVNIPSDNYYLTITDNNGCTANDSIEIQEPLILSGIITHTDVSTWGNIDGQATATPSGGTSPYSYEWENINASGIIISTDQTADSLSAGTYSVTVTDANGCTWSDNVIIIEPNDPLGGIITIHENVLCAPDSTGNLSASAYGATPPYNYYWENATTTLTNNSADFNNIPAGTYFLTITDNLSYEWDTTIVISQPTILEISATNQIDVGCNGDSTGVASIDISGGTPTYTIQWQEFASTNDTLFHLPTGAYNFTVTDSNGCQIDSVININEPDSIQMNFLVTGTPLCNGGNEGSAFVNMTGGTPNYTYYWEDQTNTNISNTDTITGLSSNYYYLTVTDDHGCINNDSIFVPEPTPVSISLDGVDATGFGASDAQAWATGTGGTTPYNYQWEDITNLGVIISNTDSLQNVTIGTYSVTLTDDNGCTISDQITLNQPDELIHTIIGSNVHCFGDTTGGAWIQTNGGVTPYSFVWEDSDGNEIWNDSVMIFIPADEYFVTVTDFNGYTNNDSITITEPPALYFNLDSMQNVLCYDENSAYIDLNPSGGTLPFTYAWTENSDPTNILDTDDFIENIVSGEYILTIIDDSTCIYDTTINIIQPDSLEVILEAQGDITCFGYNNGFIDVQILGGTPPYSYTWLDPENNIIATNSDSIGNLISGQYELIVSDNNNCSTDTLHYSIIEPLPFSFNAIVDSIYCYGDNTGTIQLNPTGGTVNYTYTWEYEGDTIDDCNFAAMFNLSAGNYDIYVSDANECSYDTSLVIHQPSTLPSISTSLTDTLDCYGDSDAQVLVQLNGGTTMYNLSWTNGTGGDGELENIAPGSHTITGITGGNFIFTVEDHYGCTSNSTILVTEPEQLQVNMYATHISCYGSNDGTIEADVTGGNLPYLYTWDSMTAGSDTSLTNLAEGFHYITVTDNNMCSVMDSALIYQPDSITINLQDTLYLNCYGDNNASTLATISGGTIPITSTWTNGAGDTIQYGPYITNLQADMYFLTVNDGNGCSAIDTTIVHSPHPLEASMESFLTSCPSSADGYAIISMLEDAGTTPYSYEWDNPEHSVTNTATNLDAEWWHVTVTDANSCVYLDSVKISSPDSLDMSFTVTPVQCNLNPGSVVIHTDGGTPSYEYAWSTLDTTGIINNIPAGIHTVTVTDLHGCTWAEQVLIESEGNINTEINISEPISCYGSKDGELIAIVNNGALPFVFDWNNGDITQSIDELSSGTYSIMVTDAWGCIGTDTLTLTQPDGITIEFNTQDVLCLGGNSGWAQAIAHGGNGNFSYAWDATFYGNPYTNLSQGNYTVFATDQNNCSGIATVEIIEPENPIYALAETRDVTCYGYNNGRALAQGFGGTPPYQYIWYGPGNDTVHLQQTPPSLFPGNYYLEVSDVNGCLYDSIVKIRQPSPIYIDVSGYGSPTCSGMDDGWIELDSITGGTPPYNIFLNGGGISWTQQNTFIDSIPSGLYSISVYDANHCLQNNETILLTLDESDEDCIRIPAAFSPNGDGFNDLWQIDHLELFRRALIQVYNRWGQLLYEAGWDDEFWNGKYNGNPVPTGAYIYYINLGTNSRKPITGTVTIIR